MVTPEQTANPGGEPGPLPCGEFYPMVSADGKTATCAAVPGDGTGGPRRMAWQTYALPDLLADIGGGTRVYEATVDVPDGYSSPGSGVTMHAGELPVTDDVVRDLVTAHFPRWRDLPVRRFGSSGTVNAIFRLGDRLAARFPLEPGHPTPS